MASASTTPNLNLPQWVGTEKPERTDFNAAFDTIDTNLNLVDNTVAAHLTDNAAHSDIRTLLGTKATIVTGITTTSVTIPGPYYGHALIIIGNTPNVGIFVANRGRIVVVKDITTVYTLTQAANGEITISSNGTFNMSYTVIK